MLDQLSICPDLNSVFELQREKWKGTKICRLSYVGPIVGALILSETIVQQSTAGRHNPGAFCLSTCKLRKYKYFFFFETGKTDGVWERRKIFIQIIEALRKNRENSPPLKEYEIETVLRNAEYKCTFWPVNWQVGPWATRSFLHRDARKAVISIFSSHVLYNVLKINVLKINSTCTLHVVHIHIVHGKITFPHT